jgi:hypothetical protein
MTKESSTLSQVLLSLQSMEQSMEVNFAYNRSQKLPKNYCEIHFDNRHWSGVKILWNLTKKTLEEQSEETQRAINQILK